LGKGILAFDLALVTGWALCRYDHVRGEYFYVEKTGVIDAHLYKEPSPLTERVYVKRLFKFGRALDAVILCYLEHIHRVKQRKPVDIVAYESTSWRAKKGTSTKTKEIALKLAGVLLEHLWYLETIGVEVMRVAPQEWQPFIFGDKYKTKQTSVIRKKLSFDHARSLGYQPESHHEADAINLAYFVATIQSDAVFAVIKMGTSVVLYMINAYQARRCSEGENGTQNFRG